MFKVTGVSRFKGQVKVRFANDMTRIKLLIKAGNDDIELIELPEPTDKAGCVRALQQSALYSVPAFAAAIDEAADKYLKTTSASKRKPAYTKVPRALSMDAIRARALANAAAVETEVAAAALAETVTV